MDAEPQIYNTVRSTN